jgi:hypothetical protein
MKKKQINQQADTAPHSVKRFGQPQGPESAKLLRTNLLTSLKHNIQKLKIIQNQILKELLRSSS